MFRASQLFMPRLSYQLSKKGLLNTPGITASSKQKTEEVLLKDAETHHCFFRGSAFHNHLSHHILAAYDLGAPAGHIEKIYDGEKLSQRPRILEEKDKSIVVNNENWVQYLGNQSAYSSFVDFFSKEIQDHGSTATLEKYIFESHEKGAQMLLRVMSGAVHPFIQIGYGAEFGNDTLIATGLAQAAMHTPIEGTQFPTDKSVTADPKYTILELLRDVYDSELLKPPLPYDNNLLYFTRIERALANGGREEVKRISAKYHVSDNIADVEIATKTEEIIWASALLMAGTGKKNRKPRLDFFLMHLLTSSLFIRPLCAALKKLEHKAALLRAYVPQFILIVLARGRPRIDAELIMSYSDIPRPPGDAAKSSGVSSSTKEMLGSPSVDSDYNPWPAMIEGVRYHEDSHVLKAMRTLIFATQHFGDTPAGGVIGAKGSDGKETHKGISKVDGTIFVRAGGLVLDTLGWVSYGQKNGEWDRSGLGWESAWESGD